MSGPARGSCESLREVYSRLATFQASPAAHSRDVREDVALANPSADAGPTDLGEVDRMLLGEHAGRLARCQSRPVHVVAAREPGSAVGASRLDRRAAGSDRPVTGLRRDRGSPARGSGGTNLGSIGSASIDSSSTSGALRLRSGFGALTADRLRGSARGAPRGPAAGHGDLASELYRGSADPCWAKIRVSSPSAVEWTSNSRFADRQPADRLVAATRSPTPLTQLTITA